MFFQVGKDSGDARRREIQRAGGFGKASFIHDAGEDREPQQLVHARLFCKTKRGILPGLVFRHEGDPYSGAIPATHPQEIVMSNSRKTFVQRATQAIREARQLVIAFEALLRSMKGVVQTVLATVLLVAATWTQVQAKLAPIAGLFS
jgi:hypothetical protein